MTAPHASPATDAPAPLRRWVLGVSIAVVVACWLFSPHPEWPEGTWARALAVGMAALYLVVLVRVWRRGPERGITRAKWHRELLLGLASAAMPLGLLLWSFDVAAAWWAPLRLVGYVALGALVWSGHRRRHALAGAPAN